jgi:hypothetical protein
MSRSRPRLAFSAFAINDADYLEATGGGGDLIEKPNGTGPYTLAEWRRGDQMIFQRFEELLGRQGHPGHRRLPLGCGKRAAPGRTAGRHGRRHRRRWPG